MSNRTKIILKAIAALIVVAGIGLALASRNDAPHSTPPATHEQNPCPDSKPCIQLTAADGTKYKLNDFRFLPDHCIAIVSLPDNTSRKLCGTWHMDWIGPDTTNDIRSQKI